MDITEYMGGTDGTEDILGLGDYADELRGAFDENAVGELEGGVDPTELVRSVQALQAARNGAAQARAKALAVAKKNKGARRKAAENAARQHAMNFATLAAIGSMHAHSRAHARKQANYAVGMSFEAVPANGLSDTATLKSPISDEPWHIVSFQASLSQLIDFNLVKFVPATVDIVSYGSAGISYAATTPAAGFIPLMWAVESFGAGTGHAQWQLAPWQRPGWVFGGSATVQVQVLNTNAAARTLRVLVLGQCSPCKTTKRKSNIFSDMERVGASWHAGHRTAFFG